ncbi:molybdopterin-dependent oxidoreductase [Gammaproteobacteria bacterium]|nr:molybdopterin-dependent oxidoreductase [Gammaproteobacteria bacterium]
MVNDEGWIKTTCPRDCYDGCGIIVSKRDGEIFRVKGNREHPSTRGPLCAKCAVGYNGVWRDENVRLLHPLKLTGKKGAGQFKRISWDEALEEIAQRLGDIDRRYGADKIYQTHYTGTCSVIAGDFPQRFFTHLGATEVDPDTICNAAGHAALRYVFGSSVAGFDPRTAQDSACVLVWGANPSHCGPHVHKHWLYEYPAKVIVIDPVRTDTAAAADLHLQGRPGTDAALAFAMLHVIRREGLVDEKYVGAHVEGYEEVASSIERCTPEWGEEATGIPAALIGRAARMYASGPSLLWLGQGLQRQPQGGNVFRACAMLPALTGNIGKPGAGFYYLNDTFEIGGRQGAAPVYEEPRSKNDRGTVSQMDIPQLLQDPTTIRSYMVWNCNPIASNPNQTLMRRGLTREDLFTVVIDCFMTDTADHADIVLPAASFLEFDDLCASYFHLMIGPQVKCSEPMGESLPNQEIFRRLAKAMGFERPDLYEDDRSIIEQALRASGVQETWKELIERGWAYVTDESLVLWAEGRYPTPSGKIEIASARAEADGHPRLPQVTVDAEPPAGKVRLISPADKWLMNSSFGNDPRVIKMMGPATVTIHPETASHLGIGDGDRVRLSNELGELEITACVSQRVVPGSLLAYKSRWLKYEDGRVNVNVLHAPRKTDMGESTAVHATEVTVSRID